MLEEKVRHVNESDVPLDARRVCLVLKSAVPR